MAHRLGPVAIAALVLAGACSPSPTAPASGPAAGGTPAASGLAGTQTCAWPRQVDASTSNTIIPDTGAVYWIQFFQFAPGLKIVLSGTFPDARYVSLQVYDGIGSPFTRNGVGSTLTDYQIAPDAGSVNPWQQQAAPGGHYTVTLREDLAPGERNTMPIAPTGSTGGLGILVYRVYLPAAGDIARIALPGITLQQAGQSASLAPCTVFNLPGSAPQPASPGTAATPTATPAPSASSAPPGQLRFFKATIGSLAPNTDTSYALAYLTPPGPADVAVIRGRAPTHATGAHPSPWPAAGVDMRYWSMCIALATGVLPTVMNLAPGGGVDAGCRADDDVKVDAVGDYAFVLGTEAQRAAIDGVSGTTFLPFSAAQPATTHLLMLRNMLVSQDFGASPARVPGGNDPAATAGAMGPYYPQATVCPLATLTSAGVAGCFK